MRRVVIAPSFDREAENIGIAIEQRFGQKARRDFVASLEHLCQVIATLPGIGKTQHGYKTKLVGFVLGPNWVFFEFDDAEIRFLHIVDARRNRRGISF
jgi:plasmid stabilization system protein ParE